MNEIIIPIFIIWRYDFEILITNNKFYEFIIIYLDLMILNNSLITAWYLYFVFESCFLLSCWCSEKDSISTKNLSNSAALGLVMLCYSLLSLLRRLNIQLMKQCASGREGWRLNTSLIKTHLIVVSIYRAPNWAWWWTWIENCNN